MTPEQLSALLLALTGTVIQLAFMYIPKAKDWYEKQPNKGPIMLVAVIVVAGVYFGLSCTSLAVLLNIVLTCDTAGAFTLVRAIFLIAVGQQLTYLYTRNSKLFGRVRS